MSLTCDLRLLVVTGCFKSYVFKILSCLILNFKDTKRIIAIPYFALSRFIYAEENSRPIQAVPNIFQKQRHINQEHI